MNPLILILLYYPVYAHSDRVPSQVLSNLGTYHDQTDLFSHIWKSASYLISMEPITTLETKP